MKIPTLCNGVLLLSEVKAGKETQTSSQSSSIMLIRSLDCSTGAHFPVLHNSKRCVSEDEPACSHSTRLRCIYHSARSHPHAIAGYEPPPCDSRAPAKHAEITEMPKDFTNSPASAQPLAALSFRWQIHTLCECEHVKLKWPRYTLITLEKH